MRLARAAVDNAHLDLLTSRGREGKGGPGEGIRLDTSHSRAWHAPNDSLHAAAQGGAAGQLSGHLCTLTNQYGFEWIGAGCVRCINAAWRRRNRGSTPPPRPLPAGGAAPSRRGAACVPHAEHQRQIPRPSAPPHLLLASGGVPCGGGSDACQVVQVRAWRRGAREWKPVAASGWARTRGKRRAAQGSAVCTAGLSAPL